jgi:hypothetical protein
LVTFRRLDLSCLDQVVMKQVSKLRVDDIIYVWLPTIVGHWKSMLT